MARQRACQHRADCLEQVKPPPTRSRHRIATRVGPIFGGASFWRARLCAARLPCGLGHPAAPPSPTQLRGDPGEWSSIELPAALAAHLANDRVDLTEPSARRRFLPRLLETGPADLVATVVTLPQLRTEWPQLELSAVLREAWEDAYPALTDDIGHTDHRSRNTDAAR